MAAQLSLSLALDRADAGIQSSGEHADRVESGWRFQAMTLVALYARQIGRPFVIEEARAFAEANGLPFPPDGRAWGSATRLAAAKKRIRKVGYAPTASSHGSPKVQWEAA